MPTDFAMTTDLFGADLPPGLEAHCLAVPADSSAQNSAPFRGNSSRPRTV